eukprot:m.34437 g.34437  ORF g.34437 m.34437 type:complete len:786 (-) comp9767_c0_seq2:347-2704(-)
MSASEAHPPLINTILAHGSPVLGVAVSPDGLMIASCSKDKTARVFETTSGDDVHTLRGHHDRINAVAFSPKDPKVLVTASKDKTLRSWDVETGHVLKTFRGHSGEVLSMSFSPDGLSLASCATDMRVIVWDVATGNTLRILDGHDAPVMSCCFSPPGKRFLVSADESGCVMVWNAQTGKVFKRFGAHDDAITCVKYSTLDPNIIVTTSRDKTARAWTVEPPKNFAAFLKHEDVVSSCAFSPDGWLLATCSADTTAALWNVSNNECVAYLSHKGAVSACCFTPEGTLLVTADWTGCVKVWNIQGLESPGRSPFGLMPNSEPTTPTGSAKGSSSQLIPPPATTHINTSVVVTSAGTTPISPVVPGTSVTSHSAQLTLTPTQSPSGRVSPVPSSLSTSNSPAQAHISAQLSDEVVRLRNLNEDIKGQLIDEVKARAAAEERLREAEARVRQLTEQMQDQAETARITELELRAQARTLREDIEAEQSARFELEDEKEGQQHHWLIEEDEVKIDTVLRDGASSVIYAGEWQFSSVVVKEFREKLRTAYHVEVWQRSLGDIALLKHPNILPIYGAHLAMSASPLLVVQNMQGSLQELIELGKKLTCREVCDIVAGVSAGLAYLHRFKIVHQLLSCRKVLLNEFMTPCISGINEAVCVKETFIQPTAEAMGVSEVTPSALPLLMATDVTMLGRIITEVSLGQRVKMSTVTSSALHIEWEPVKVLAANCVKEVAEERISAAMVAKLSTELIKSEYSPYSSCPPRRKIKKMSSGLVFDTSSRVCTCLFMMSQDI